MRTNIQQKALLYLFLFVLITILFVACATPGTQSENGDDGIYQVSGHVMDEKGQPVDGACVTFSGGFSALYTEESGAFVKAGLSGTVTITVIKEGYTFEATTLNQACDDLVFIGEPVSVEYIRVSNPQELKATEMSTKEGNKVILIESGVYHMDTHLFLTGNHLTYQSVSGNRDDVVIQGNFQVGSLFMVAGDHFTIKDLSIGKVNHHGIQVHGERDADDVHVQNVRFFDIREQMIKGSKAVDPHATQSCDNGIVENCLFEFTSGKAYQYYTGGIDVHNGANWIVRNNTFRNICNPDGALTEGAIHFWSDSRGTVIEKNIIINCDRGIMLGMDSSGHDEGVIKNNFIVTNRDTGIYLCHAKNTLVYNNTIFIDSAYDNAVEYRFNTGGSEIKNNLTNRPIRSRDGGEAVLNNNVDNANQNWFVDVQTGDLHLSSRILSVIDCGVQLIEVIEDIDGQQRDIHDIGADELDEAFLPIKHLVLNSSKEEIIANGIDGATLTVEAVYEDDSSEEIIPDYFECITAQGEALAMEENVFRVYSPGEYAIQAIAGSATSNRVQITAVEESLEQLQVENLSVFHHAGQSFITWDEITQIMPGNDITYGTFFQVKDRYSRDITYNIYRSHQKIESLQGLEPIQIVKSLTCWNQDFYGRDNTPKETEKPAIRYVIKNGETALENGTGLFVNNPDESGEYYYAVSAVVGGVENQTVSAKNALQEPVSEGVGQGEPVLQRIEHDDRFHYVEDVEKYYYTRWEAPPNASVKGKPFDYLVAIPSNLMVPAPVGLHLHCWGGSLNSGYGWWNDGLQGKILLSSNQYPYDWWTGYHEFLYTEREAEDWSDGVIRPYTTNRMFSFLDWMVEKSSWDIDLARTFTAGTSMGGSGTLMMAIRYPNRIAYSRSWVGVHIPEDSPTFKGSYEQVYGEVEEALLFENGTPVWDYYNDVWYLRNHPNAEIGFLAFSNGKNDSAIGWEQAVAFVNTLQETRRPHLFIFGQAGHSQRTVLPKNNSEREMCIDVKTNRTLPAFTRCSLDDDPGNGHPEEGDAEGQINRWLYWETDDLVDSASAWEITVALMDQAPENECLVDITPRKAQVFKPIPGTVLSWENQDFSTGGVLESGEITVDEWGLFTIEQTIVSNKKNRIVIRIANDPVL